LTAGSHTVIASYSGDGSFTTSSGTLSGGQVVNNKGTTATTTTARSSANVTVFGQSVTFTATIGVPSGTPTGTVQFQIDGSNAGNPVNVTTAGGVTSATFSISTLTVGTHTVTASYSGDVNFASSSGALSGGQTVTKASTSMAVN